MNIRRSFTLIELIITIWIIAIISTVTVISLSKWLNTTKDGKRIWDLNTITTALETYIYNQWEYPTPDSNISINFSWSLIINQWYLWTSVSNTINLKWEIKDPKDSSYYVYSISNDKSDFQLLSHFEQAPWKLLWNLSSNKAIWANNLSNRFIVTKWDKLWTIVNSDNTPVQDLYTGIDLNIFTWEIKSYFTKDDYIINTWWWIISSMAIYRSSVWYLDNSLSLLLNFDEWKSFVTYDKSKNNMNWQLIYWTKWVEWINWKWIKFDGIDSAKVIDKNNSSLDSSDWITISLWISIEKLPSNYASIIDKQWAFWIKILSEWVYQWYIWSTNLNMNATINQWQNIILTYDKSNIKMYINGELISSVSDTSNIAINDYDLKIWEKNLLWSIDELRIYNRALNENEIKFIFKGMQ